MLGFTLSKINLLIFVIAIFTIISYFFFGLSEVAIERIAGDYVRVIGEDAQTIIGSQALCESKTFYLRPALNTSTSSTYNKGLYYLLLIKSSPFEKTNPDGTKQNLNMVIFSISKRKQPDSSIAAFSFSTDAEVNFFDFDDLSDAKDESDGYASLSLSTEGTKNDPQRAPAPGDAFILVKEVQKGKKMVYFIPCSSSQQGVICKTFFEKAGQRVHGKGNSFNCVPERMYSAG